MSRDVSPSQDRKQQVAAAGGVVGSLLASSCCIGPLLLIMLGASGAWIGSLSALKAYQPVFVTLTVGFLAFGFWQVYGRPDITTRTIHWMKDTLGGSKSDDADWCGKHHGQG